MLHLLPTAESVTSQSVVEVLNLDISEKGRVSYVLSELGGLGLLSRGRRTSGCNVQWFPVPGCRKACTKSNIGITYLYVRTNPGVFRASDLVKGLNIKAHNMYEILHVLMGLGVVTMAKPGLYKTATPSNPALPWQQTLDDIWGNSNEPTTNSLVVRGEHPECKVACITGDNPMSKSVSISAESNGTQSESHESQVGRTDITDLTLENFPFDEFTMDFPESKVDWTHADSLRESILWLDMETEGLFSFKKDTACPTPKDIAQLL